MSLFRLWKDYTGGVPWESQNIPVEMAEGRLALQAQAVREAQGR